MVILRFRHTPISLATTFGIIGYSLFLDLLRWFSSARSRFLLYVFKQAQYDMTRIRFPHSAIPGSFLAVRSPRLIADFYGLHRYWLSRHPLSVPLITFLCIDLTSNRHLISITCSVFKIFIVSKLLIRKSKRIIASCLTQPQLLLAFITICRGRKRRLA